MSVYSGRVASLAAFLKDRRIAVAVFHDSEDHRDRSVRYLCGHGFDALLAVTAEGEAFLVPWDVQMASAAASGVSITPLTDFGMDSVKALAAVLRTAGITSGSIELPPYTTVGEAAAYKKDLGSFTILFDEGMGAHNALVEARAVKDDSEIVCLKKAGDIACDIADLITKGITEGSVKTESDAALLIERESRARGGEGASFAILAAGPSRSFAIHCFPNYTAGPFAAEGLSILDFGVTYEGYRSDVTYTFAVKPGAAQKERMALVEEAYFAALPFYRAGTPVSAAAREVAALFARSNLSMPHGLGHGIGLDIHEFPRINTRQKDSLTFKAGMVVTLEPGLYDGALGGCRWENDILITSGAPEVLTRSRILCL